jgi:3D (Asp-Asp-Asp) domain-containing protein
MKYAKDCEQAFGYFVHHYPYIGMRGKEDEQVRLDSGERMRTLYEATFGDSFAERAAELSQLTAVRTVPVPGKPGTRPIDLSGMAAKAASHPQSAIAYCAGPVPTVSATAYCAGPVPTVSATAYCAGPVPTVSATAYCAGPVPTVSATAYCAGPVPTVGIAASRASTQPASAARH